MGVQTPDGQVDDVSAEITIHGRLRLFIKLSISQLAVQVNIYNCSQVRGEVKRCYVSMILASCCIIYDAMLILSSNLLK